MNRFECRKCEKSVDEKDLITEFDGKHKQCFHRGENGEKCGPIIEHLGISVGSSWPAWGDKMSAGPSRKA